MLASRIGDFIDLINYFNENILPGSEDLALSTSESLDSTLNFLLLLASLSLESGFSC